MMYTISIGDVLMCKWSGEEDNWESKHNDPEKYPYHESTLKPSGAAAEETKKKKASQKSGNAKEPAYPDVVTKRLCIPFEFRFTSQDVSS